MPIYVPSILERQQRGREVGRIRLGAKVQFTKKDGSPGERPVKLENFRFTSKRKDVIRAVAEWLGGEVRPWIEEGQQWETFTDANVLPVVVPPGAAVSQWMELWGKTKDGVVCLRRCTGGPGAVNQKNHKPCECPADDDERRQLAAANPPRACKPRTRLYVMLPGMPDFGVWPVVSSGENAAVEIPHFHKLLVAMAEGRYVQARLRLDSRHSGKHQFGVPVLEMPEDVSMAQIAAEKNGGSLPAILAGMMPAAVETPKRAALPAAPEPKVGEVVADTRTAVDFAELARSATTRNELLGIGEQAREAGVMEALLPPVGNSPPITLHAWLLGLLDEVASAGAAGAA